MGLWPGSFDRPANTAIVMEFRPSLYAALCSLVCVPCLDAAGVDCDGCSVRRRVARLCCSTYSVKKQGPRTGYEWGENAAGFKTKEARDEAKLGDIADVHVSQSKSIFVSAGSLAVRFVLRI